MKSLNNIKRFNEHQENFNTSDVSRSFKVVFDGFETEEQAKTFASWYEGSGEQDSALWMENIGITAANVDMTKYHEQGGFFANENNEIIVPLKLYK